MIHEDLLTLYMNQILYLLIYILVLVILISLTFKFS